MLKKIKNLKIPQKQKYRVFAWKNKEKPFECWDTEDLDEAIHKAGDFFEDKRDFVFNVRKENILGEKNIKAIQEAVEKTRDKIDPYKPLIK